MREIKMILAQIDDVTLEKVGQNDRLVTEIIDGKNETYLLRDGWSTGEAEKAWSDPEQYVKNWIDSRNTNENGADANRRTAHFRSYQ